MDLIFEQAQQLIERSIFEALRKYLVQIGYLPDIVPHIGQITGEGDYESEKETITNTRGFCIDLFGVGSPQSRFLKKVPRIVIRSRRVLPGTVGSPFAKIYYRESESENYKLAKLPALSSELVYDIHVVFNETRQERVMNDVIGNVLPNMTYLKTYNAEEETDRFFIEQVSYGDYNDFDEGVVEKIYTFKVPDVYITKTLVDDSFEISAIKEITVDIEKVESPFNQPETEGYVPFAPGKVFTNNILIAEISDGGIINITIRYQTQGSVGTVDIVNNEVVIPDPGTPGQVTLKNSNLDPLRSFPVASGDSVEETIADTRVQLVDSDGAPIGAPQSFLAESDENTNTLIAPDGTVGLNNIIVGVVKSNGVIDVPVEYEDGSPVGSLNGNVWEIPNPEKDLITYIQFDAGAPLDYTITINADTAGTYTTAQYSGDMVSATYQVNGLPDTLPFLLNPLDTLRIIPNAKGVVKLSGTYP